MCDKRKQENKEGDNSTRRSRGERARERKRHRREQARRAKGKANGYMFHPYEHFH